MAPVGQAFEWAEGGEGSLGLGLRAVERAHGLARLHEKRRVHDLGDELTSPHLHALDTARSAVGGRGHGAVGERAVGRSGGRHGGRLSINLFA